MAEHRAVRAGAVVRCAAPGYLLGKRGESRSSRLLAGGGGGVCRFPGAEGWVLCLLSRSRRCRAAVSSAVTALEVSSNEGLASLFRACRFSSGETRVVGVGWGLRASQMQPGSFGYGSAMF